MSQYTIIYKYGLHMHQLEFKKELKNFPLITVAASENHFTPELNEKEVIELLGSTKKATKYGMKIVQGRNLKTLF